MSSGSACFFGLSFAPTTAGAQTNNLLVSYTGVSGSPFSIAVKGTGSAAVTASPNPVLFSDTAPGGTGSASVTIGNGTALSVTFGTISSFTGSNPGLFSVNFDSCSGSTLPSQGTSCQIYLYFKPLSSGNNLSAQFTLPYSVGGGLQQTLTVTMNGSSPAPTAPVVSAAPNPLIFSTSQAVNTQSQVANVVVTNTGNALFISLVFKSAEQMGTTSRLPR